MAHIVAIANQKGGVGKTTTAVNLAASLAIAERRTLLLDADPQGNATSGVGIVKHELQLSLYDSLVEGYPPGEAVLPVPGLPHLAVLPATQDLVGAELQLVERPHREAALRSVLDPLQADYDYIVVDCPPSLGLLTLNVLAGANTVLIPIQCEYYGLEGISQLLNTVRLVQQNFNPGLAISGVLLTMYDARLNLCRQVAEDAKEYFGAKMFVTPIPRNVRLAEAPSFGKPILLYDVQSVGAKSYLAVAQELIRRLEGTPPERPRAVSVQPQDSVAALEAAALAASAQAAAKESSQTDNPDERASVEAASDNADTIAGSPNISGSENDTSNHPVNDGESDLLPSEQRASDQRASDQRASDQRASDQRASDQRVSGELASPETASNGAASAQGSSEPIVTERAAAESPDESPVALHAAEAIASDGLSAGDRAAQIGDASAPDVGSRESQSHEPEVTT
jgi:chromosome partitioning protein